MKKLEIIINPEQLEDIKEILVDSDIQGMMISNIMGFGNQKGYRKNYRGTFYTVNFLPKMKIETIVLDAKADELIDKITKTLVSDDIGGGKIFVYNVDDVVRIRTGETGIEAL